MNFINENVPYIAYYLKYSQLRVVAIPKQPTLDDQCLRGKKLMSFDFMNFELQIHFIFFLALMPMLVAFTQTSVHASKNLGFLFVFWCAAFARFLLASAENMVTKTQIC